MPCRRTVRLGWALTLSCLVGLMLPHPGEARPAFGARGFTLEWVGDMAFGSDYGLPPGGPRAALRSLGSVLHGADITAGNLEGTLTSRGTSKCSGRGGPTCFAFRAPTSYASDLRSLGFSVLNQANNHALDFGAVGQRDTAAALGRAGIVFTGRPGQVTVRRIRGLRVAFLGFAPYPWASSLTDIAGAQRLVRRARAQARLVVVFIHAGAEGADQVHTPLGTQYYLGENRGDARRFAHAVIDAGASVVLGSGPHVVRGIERYRDHLIAYSLGNFIGPHTLTTGGTLSLSGILRVTLDRAGRLVRGRWISLRLAAPGVPHLDPTNASAKLVAHLSRHDFGAHRFLIHSDGSIRLGGRPAAL